MVFIGVYAYNEMPLHFKKPPSEVSKLVYNQFYLVPYAGMSLALLIFALLGISALLRIWLAAICLGLSTFCMFFIQASSVGHDFGHVIYGGCFESRGMISLIVSLNILLLVSCCMMTYYSARDWNRSRHPAVA